MNFEDVRTLPAEPLPYRDAVAGTLHDDPAAIFGHPWDGAEPLLQPALAQPRLALAFATQTDALPQAALPAAPRPQRRGLFFRRNRE